MQAQFDGKQREFNIDRANIPFLEYSLGRSLYQLLKDFTEGRWTFDAVACVLSYALHGPDRDGKLMIGFLRSAAKYGLPPPLTGKYKPHPDVVAVLHRDGHGNFAPLAADILTFAIFGARAAEAVDEAA